MADISAQGPTDFGALMTSFGRGNAEINQANSAAGVNQAQLPLIQQQVQAARVANAQSIMSYNLRRNALLDFSGQQSNASGDQVTAPSAPTSSTGADPNAAPGAPYGTLPGSPAPSEDDVGMSVGNYAHMDNGLRQRFFVNPAGTPQEMQMISQAALSGDKGLLEYAKQRRDMGVTTRTAANQRDANSMYETLSAVANAPDGRAFDALEAVSPQLAAQIKKAHPDDADARDEAVRDSSGHLSAVLHQYTGRDISERKDGTYVDAVTKQPLPATPHSGMDTAQTAAVLKDANELISVKSSDGTETQEPRWQVAGYKNAGGYLHAVGDQWRAQSMIPPVQQTALASQQAKLDALRNHFGAPGTQPGAAPGAPGAPGSAQAPPQGPAAGGPMAIALQDKSFRSPIANQPVTAGVSQSPLNKGLTDSYVGQRKELQDSAGENANAASQSLASFKAAQAILNAPDGSNIAGVLPGSIAQELAKLGFNTDTGAHRIEVAKYLTNGALQNLKTVYGAKPGVFDVKVNLDQAFPNIATMNDASIKALVASQIRNASYIRDSAMRVPMFLAAKNEPSAFNSWNEKYFTRSDAVNEQPKRPGQQTSGAGSGGPAVGTVRGGYKFTGGDPAKQTSWVKQ